MRFLLIAAAVASLLMSSGAHAQSPQAEPAYRETQVRQGAYATGPAPAWVTPADIPESTLSGDAIRRLSETHFLAGAVPAFYIRQVIQINSPAGMANLGPIIMNFVPEYQSLTLNTLRILRGTEVIDVRDTAKVRFLQRETGLEQGVYQGVVTASILLDDLRVGDILDFASTTTGINPVFGGKYFESAAWTPPVPTEMRRVVLQYPDKRPVHYRFLGPIPQGEASKPLRSMVGDMVRLQFEERRPAIVAAELFTPPSYDASTSLEFSEYGSWNDVARWAADLFVNKEAPDTQFTQRVTALQAAPTEEEKILQAIRYVQNEIRYFSVSFNESTHRPAAPGLTLQRRYGDCKDKSLLLVSLLKQLGVRADIVLVASKRYKNMDAQPPSPGVFDHVIVKLAHNGKEYFVDPTQVGQAGTLETMGQYLTGAEVLVVDKASRSLVTIRNTDTYAATPNSELHETMSWPDFDKPATFESKLIVRGKYAESMRQGAQSLPAQFDTFRTRYLAQRYPEARRIGNAELSDDLLANQLTIIDRYTIDKPGEMRQDTRLVTFAPSNFFDAIRVISGAQRSTPMVLPDAPQELRYSFDLNLPANVSAMFDPRSEKINNDYFKFKLNERFRGNTMHMDLVLKVVADAVPATGMKTYLGDLKQMGELIRGVVPIQPRLLKATAPANSDPAQVLAQRLREQQQTEIGVYSKVIKDNKLTGKDLAAVYAARAVSHSNLMQMDEALADILQASRLDPSESDHPLDLAIIYEKRGQNQAAIEQVKRALVLGADPYRIYTLRGQIYSQMGKYEDALRDLEQAALSQDNKPGLPYARLWYLWTLGQAGLPVPATLKQQLDQELTGPWPRAAYGMFTGASTPETVLAQVQKMQGEERLMALCEAYFYVGKYYLVKGNKAKAREYFEKTRATGLTIYTEYVAAVQELECMDRPEQPAAGSQ